MSKNPNRNSKSVKRDEPMNGAMKLFLAGCVAELYLLVIRRFYVSGTIYQLLACHTALLYVMIAGAVVLVLAALLIRKADRSHGMLGKLQILPANADALPIYAACGLSFVAVAVALFNTTVAYYAMWALALVVFILAVYYTVKQL